MKLLIQCSPVIIWDALNGARIISIALGEKHMLLLTDQGTGMQSLFLINTRSIAIYLTRSAHYHVDCVSVGTRRQLQRATGARRPAAPPEACTGATPHTRTTILRCSFIVQLFYVMLLYAVSIILYAGGSSDVQVRGAGRHFQQFLCCSHRYIQTPTRTHSLLSFSRFLLSVASD